MSQSIDVEAFVAEHLELLALEREAEIDDARRQTEECSEAELERRGVMLRRLVVTDRSVGLGGRAVIALEPSSGGRLPAHRITPGDVVVVRASRSASADGEPASAVVARVTANSLTIALDDADAEVPDLVRIDRAIPDITYRRMRAALQAMQRLRRGPAADLRDVAFGHREPRVDEPGARPPAIDPALDESQRVAVDFALRAHPLVLVHGPPGTGKTTAVVEIIRQAAQRGERILACAPSNVAVDNLVERLAARGLRVVRLGHPARLLPSVLEHSLASLVDDATDPRLIKDIRREVGVAYKRLDRTTDHDERRRLKQEIRRLRDEVRTIEDAAVVFVIGRAEVVLTTTTGAADTALDDLEFDLVVIDEAAQAIEAACWIALIRGRRAVLAGDHLQLPPTVVSAEAQRRGLDRTLFARIADAYGERVTRMLTVQYRMNERIMEWSSAALYDGRIEAADVVRHHRLVDLDHVVATPETEAVLWLVDTAGCGLDEALDVREGSKANPGEAQLVRAHVDALLAAGVRTDEIGVITPYNAQVQLLREALAEHEGLEIGTVDGFQGREKEAIVLSLVRSNPDGEVGFLRDRRRMNVAVTRARRHLALFADSATIAQDEFLASLIEHCHARGTWHSAWEFLHGTA